PPCPCVTRARPPFPPRRSSDLRRLGCELAPAGEAVAAHFIPRAAPEVAVLRQAAHIGEDIRRAAAPEALVALPEVFRAVRAAHRSEEHTAELQSRFDLVCRLLL